MKKVLCFGESLLRLSPQQNDEWINNNRLCVHISGAELNVASALAVWGMPVKYCTALPENFIGNEMIKAIQLKGIDVSAVQISGNRVGIYYLTQGKNITNNNVIYDREGSSFSGLKKGDLNWDEILNDVNWLHFSAICPALNDTIVDVCEEALEAAHKKGIPISIDLNYREKLWEQYRNKIQIINLLANYCTVIMGNIWSAQKLLGTTHHFSPNAAKDEYIETALRVSLEIKSRFSNCKIVANTFRFTEDKITYYAAGLVENSFVYSKEWHTKQIVNRVGSGDCFMAGLIFGLQNKFVPQKMIDFATSAAFGKLQEMGDATQQTEAEIIYRLAHG